MSLQARANPIVVDREAGETDSSTTISYEKAESEVVWIRPSGRSWTRADLLVLTHSSAAETKGEFTITLQPGQFFDIAIYQREREPMNGVDVPSRFEAFVRVFCIWKTPEVRKLIIDEDQEVGGTWYHHRITTSVPTGLAVVGVSRIPPFVDANGVPHVVDPDGAPVSTPQFEANHHIELEPMMPGNRIFFAAMVVDQFGNWQTLLTESRTLRRKITVQFSTLHVFNDGDPMGRGEAKFNFRVMHRTDIGTDVVIEEFFRPEAEIDDWGETDRPYALGFSHLGSLRAVTQDREKAIWVRSWSTEIDGPTEIDEYARSKSVKLPLPSGPSENISGGRLKVDCPALFGDDDYHYGVDVTFSAAYAP